MNERFDTIFEWWKLNGGLFENLEDVLPFVTVHKAPEATDSRPTPLLMGASSLQRRVIGSHDPATFSESLSRCAPDYSNRVIRKHNAVVSSWAPFFEAATLGEPALIGNGRTLDYFSAVFPVRTRSGGRMVMTYSTPITLQ